MIRAHYRKMALLCLSSLAACGPDAGSAALGAPEGPGTLTVSLTAPHPDVGAVGLVLRGESIGPPTLLDADHELYLIDAAEDGEVRLAVFGNGLSGPLVRFSVPDVGTASSYSVKLLSVADEANNVRDDLSGYGVGLVSGG